MPFSESMVPLLHHASSVVHRAVTSVRYAAAGFFLTLVGLSLPVAQGQEVTLAAWNVSTQTGGVNNFGISPLAASTADPNVTVTPLTRGDGVITTGTGAQRGFGGVGWNVTAADGETANKFFIFGVAANPGFKLSLTKIGQLDYRRSGTGATTALLQYQVGAGTFSTIQSLDLTVSATSGASLGPIDLSAISQLQNVPTGTPVTFRILPSSASGSGGTFYVFDVANSVEADLSVLGTVTTTSGTPPVITSFTPASGPAGKVVTINGTNFGASPTVSFNGTAAPGATVNAARTQITVTVPAGAATGLILVSSAGGSANSSTVFTIPPQPALTVTASPVSFEENSSTEGTVERPQDAPEGNLLVTLTSSLPGKATIPATVTINSGQSFANFTITGVPDLVFGSAATVSIKASAAGYTDGSTTVTVTNVDAPPPAADPTVVINKYLNNAPSGQPDYIELLVINNGTAGTTLDMRGMIVKDFSDSMGSDNGGKFTFSESSLFEKVKTGTLVVLAFDENSSDTDGSDFSLRLGLKDPTYFTALSGFDISTTEMVMIKARDSSTAGIVGGIHALAAGNAGALFNDAVCAKVRADLTTGTGRAVMIVSEAGTIADFKNGPATGGLTLATTAFGIPNNVSNNTYIRKLRGITNLDGAASATVSNATPGSPLIGSAFFQRSSSNQTLSFNVLASASGGNVTTIRITLPVAFGVPVAGNTTLDGAGSAAATVAVSGQDVTISKAAISTENPLIVNIKSLTIPNPSAVTDFGSYPIAMAAAGSGGVLTPVSVPPVVRVTIPIANLRDVDAGGVPLDLGKTVAVEAVCTEENFNTVELSGYLQDGDFGINVFNFSQVATLIRGNRYIVMGPILVFRGLTEINPPDAGSVIDLGAATQPAPLAVSLAELLANPEALEGRLVKVAGLNRSPTELDVWNNAVSITLQDSTGTMIDIRIQAGSTASTEPSYPVTITGILSQFSGTTAPFIGGYQLMPRDPDDLKTTTVNNAYATWAAGFPGIGGPDEDADRDGHSNFMEFALGTIPNARTSLQPIEVTIVAGGPGISLIKGPGTASAVNFVIEGSVNLESWTTSPNEISIVENSTTLLKAKYLGNSPRYYFRTKVTALP